MKNFRIGEKLKKSLGTLKKPSPRDDASPAPRRIWNQPGDGTVRGPRFVGGGRGACRSQNVLARCFWSRCCKVRCAILANASRLFCAKVARFQSCFAIFLKKVWRLRAAAIVLCAVPFLHRKSAQIRQKIGTVFSLKFQRLR